MKIMRKQSLILCFMALFVILFLPSNVGKVEAATVKVSVAKVKLNKVSSEEKGLKVQWTVLKGVNGYEIYRSSGSSYQKVATAKAGTSSWTDKNAVLGKTYKYKVRAYKNTSKGKKYGNYSTIKSGKRTKVGLYRSNFFNDLNDATAVSQAKKLSTWIGGLKSKSSSSYRNIYKTGKGITIGANSRSNAYILMDIFYFKNTSNKQVTLCGVTIGDSYQTVRKKILKEFGGHVYKNGSYYNFDLGGDWGGIKAKFSNNKLKQIEFWFAYSG